MLGETHNLISSLYLPPLPTAVVVIALFLITSSDPKDKHTALLLAPVDETPETAIHAHTHSHAS